MLVEIRWPDILRAEWEENPGTPFDPAGVTGSSIGLSTPETERIGGTIWLDELSMLGAPASAPVNVPTDQPSMPAEEPAAGKPGIPCVGSMILPLLLVGLAWSLRSK